ncbi:MAG: tetraacyldisaccharide 4'-kinase [Gammaproteobacteria bacterium]|nr:tetraacyldisaccharide 4'-kinase [Gammaproteobacteria bacterium]
MRSRQGNGAARLDAIWYGGSGGRWLLWPVSLVFRAAAALRRAAYRRGIARSIELPVPVVVVGNLTVGGTGKTPLIVWLAEALTSRGLRVGIVSRGYRGGAKTWPQWVGADSDPAEVGDEPVLLAARTGCPVVAGPDRVAAARELLAQRDVDVLLSDDGLQHYRMRRAFEIAVVDGERGLGNGMCLPAGPLREPAARLGAVDAVVVNGAGAGAAVAGLPPSDADRVYRAHVAPTRVSRLADGEAAELRAFAGRDVVAVAAIGHPERFFDLLERAGAVVTRRPLPDHAAIRREDLERPAGVPALITEKDAVKCRGLADPDVWVVAVDLELEGADADRLVAAMLQRIGAGRGGADVL